MKFDEIGFWSEIKLEIIKEYAHAFTTIMKSQAWCKGYVYIDVFAGAGIHISRKTGEFVPGSPLNALEIKNPFTEYHYIDIDKQKIEILTSVTQDQQNVQIYSEDCNEALTKKAAPYFFCFLLPIMKQVRKLSLKSSTNTKLIFETEMKELDNS